MTSNRPYLIRALYEWLADNHQTPHLLVNAEHEHTQVPIEFVKNGQIILNISMTAVRDLRLDNEAISFNARFSGRPMQVYIPPEAVLGIYSAEEGRGMFFHEENHLHPENPSDNPNPPPKNNKRPKPTRPTLKVVK